MSIFTNPEIRKRWEPVLKRQSELSLRHEVVLLQGQKFKDHYLIVEGQAEVYRQLTSRRLGITSSISILHPYDVISLNGDQQAKYSIRVKSHQLRYIKLQGKERELVSTRAVNDWRSSRAEHLQAQYNKQRIHKGRKQNHKSTMLKFINNGFSTPIPRPSQQKQVTKLPVIQPKSSSLTARSMTVLKDKKTPICQDPQRLFNSVIKQYLTKKMDFESTNIPLTLGEESYTRGKQNI